MLKRALSQSAQRSFYVSKGAKDCQFFISSFTFYYYFCLVMKRYKVIRCGRIAVQTIVAVIIAAAVVAGVPCIFSRMQIVPAIAACATTWLVIWLVATLIFGRVYCSTICPCGALMELIAWISRPRKWHYSFAAPSTRLRYSILVIVVICALFGFSAVVSLSDPYSTFARIVTAAYRPAAIGVAGVTVAAATLILIIIFSRRRGRIICNTICPVGTMLGTMSKISLYHADVNTDLCVNCRKCADVCPAQCIDLNDHVIDPMRCVVCFNCMDVCPNDAIRYRRGRHQLSIPMMQRVAGREGVSAIKAEPTEPSSMSRVDRRTFLLALTGAGTAGTGFAAAGSHRYVEGSTRLIPLNYVTPPGTSSREDFLRRCTACGTCISACPTGVLTASTKQYGVRHALTPVMDFDKSYCDFSCVKCTEVCPSHALSTLTTAEKHNFPIGRARVCATNCILYENNVHCGRCAKACPKRAISIIRDSDGRRSPHVEPELCIGCGRCANVCPAEPYRAIVIEGL